MLNDEQKRILEELVTKKATDAEHSQISENNQPVKMSSEGNRNEQVKALLGCVGCAVIIFIIWVVISFLIAGYAFVNS